MSLAAIQFVCSPLTVEPTPPARRTRSQDGGHDLPAPPLTSTAQPRTPPSAARHKRRRPGATPERRQLESLQHAVKRWAKRLRRVLLQAALAGDKERIRRVADELQVLPLLGKAVKLSAERGDNDEDDRADQDELGDDEVDDEDGDDEARSAADSGSDSDDDQQRTEQHASTSTDPDEDSSDNSGSGQL